MNQADFERTAHALIGPEAPYSKIGRIRRENLRAAIAKELKKAFDSGFEMGYNTSGINGERK